MSFKHKKIVVTGAGGFIGSHLVERLVTALRLSHSEVEILVADNRKAAALLGWQPAVCLTAGLRKTIDWLARHLSSYKGEHYHL